MKKLLAVIAFAVIATAAAVAQPRSVGGYLGLMSQGVYYQHSITEKQFIDVHLGTDVGLFYGKASAAAGFDYEFIFASFPKSKATFNLFAGPGVYTGYGFITGSKGDGTIGPFFDVVGNFGFDVMFNCHLQLFAKINPAAGIAICDKYDESNNYVGKTVSLDYPRALYGVIPTIGVAYAF